MISFQLIQQTLSRAHREAVSLARFTVAAVAVSILVWHFGLRDGRSNYEIGGLYSVRDSETGFRVAKVLALDPGVVSVRLYKQTFTARPETVSPSELTLGSIDLWES